LILLGEYMNELTALLKRVGLNEYESKVYSSLSSNKTLTASEVSKKASIPRARVYDVLMSLEKKGFVMISMGRPVSFKAVEPETALMNYEKQKRDLFESELEEMKSLKEELKKNFNEKPIKESFSGVWSVSSNQINNIIALSLKNAKTSVTISTSEANALKKIGLFNSKLKALKARGIQVKFALNNGSNNSFPNELKAFNTVKSKSNARFMVFDKEKVLLFLSEKKDINEKALLIESPFIANYLSEL
jgi:sugar-specific transcriptional regulator TrmB